MSVIKLNPKQQLQYDGTLSIAVGRSRKDITWKNREMTWSDLLAKLSVTTRTRETVDEYHKMPKSKQGEIKDVGGFVGGVLSKSRRKADNVSWRSLITLDADFAGMDIWENITLINDYAIAMYSTHSHTPERPRLRLVIPLKRPVLPDEYGAVSRRIAADIGIDLFDDTTYEPSRLMYWPSTPEDGEYIFEYQDGEWLDPDKLLSRYADWRDVTQWPESSREIGIRKKLADRQGDPTEKPGIVGAFCRAHTIEDAIENYLSDIYTPCDIPNRYTYTAGSTSGGLIVYEDGKFAYSHHGTDPAGGRLCNAFDLVRLHKFSELDDDIAEGTPVNRFPSYQAMQDLAGRDEDTRIQLTSDKEAEIVADFGGSEDDTWKTQLNYSRQGKLLSTIENAVILIENCAALKDKLRYNEFAARYEVTGRLPWRKEPHAWDDLDDAGLRFFLEKTYGLSGSTKIADAVNVVMMQHGYHPVRDYLDQLEWDGQERLDTVLMDYLGTMEDTPYIRAVTRKTLVAAVKRIYKPGCKFDYVLTLRGPQGIGKTSILRKLGGPWMQENMPSMEGKEACEQIRGYWIIELGELNAVRKSEKEAVKGFLTRQIDSYRVPYGKRLTEFPRQCIFVANTNESSFLNDPTGNRRYWVVPVTGRPKIPGGWHQISQSTVDQIWAEAKFRYLQGEEVYFMEKDLIKEAELQQKKARKDSDKMGIVEEYLNTPLPENWKEMDLVGRRMYLNEAPSGTDVRDHVCVAEIYAECMNGDLGKMQRREVDELHEIMTVMDGWERYEQGTGKLYFGNIYGHQRAYIRTEKYGLNKFFDS